MRRKHLFCLGMQTYMMAHMDEECFFRSKTLDILQSLINSLMRAMRFRTQGIHYQYIQSLQESVFGFRHREHIRHPSHLQESPLPTRCGVHRVRAARQSNRECVHEVVAPYTPRHTPVHRGNGRTDEGRPNRLHGRNVRE